MNLEASGFDAREVEQVFDEVRQVVGRLADQRDLPFLLVGERTVDAFEQQSGQRGVRNSWLMFDRKRDFISSARRWWSARSSSSA